MRTPVLLVSLSAYKSTMLAVINLQESDGVAQECDGVAQSSPSRTETKHPLSLLAAQYAHAVRNVLPGEQLRGHNGDVRHMRQISDRLDTVDPQPQNRSTSEAVQDQHLQSEQATEEKAILAEAARVKAKFAYIDSKTEVVLRFDFMKESDTKARELQAESMRCV